MKRLEYLSYPLQQSNPVYGKPDQVISIKPDKSIDLGDTCNVYTITMENHWGTHVDCPAHFYSNAKRVTDYPADYWLFSNPQVMNLECKNGQIITLDDLPESIEEKTDCLIIKTGWYKHRMHPVYCLENPGISAELGLWLRNERKNIRAIGFDFISVSSYASREVGRQAHRAFLDPEGNNNPILIIEDMYLGYDLHILKELWVAPLLISSIDSAPCTVIGAFYD